MTLSRWHPSPALLSMSDQVAEPYLYTWLPADGCIMPSPLSFSDCVAAWYLLACSLALLFPDVGAGQSTVHKLETNSKLANIIPNANGL